MCVGGEGGGGGGTRGKRRHGHSPKNSDRYEEAKVRKAKLEEARRTQQEKAQRTNFRPKSFTKRSPFKKDVADPVAAGTFERLYDDGRKIAKKLASEKKRLQKEQCTFVPKINTRRSRKSASPGVKTSTKQGSGALGTAAAAASTSENDGETEDDFSTRLYNRERIVQAKKDKEDMKEKLELEKCTFAPRVNKKTVGPKRVKGKVVDRLANAGQRSAEKLKEKREQLEREEKEICSFKPEINRKVPKFLADKLKRSRQRQEGIPFHERLYDAGKMQQIRAKRMQESAGNECTFRPKINALSNSIATTMRELQMEAEEEEEEEEDTDGDNEDDDGSDVSHAPVSVLFFSESCHDKR